MKLEKKWQDFLASQPESGMGYHIVDVVFKDGTKIDNLRVSNSEKLEVSIPYLNTEIENISLHGPKKVAIKLRVKPPRRRTPQERLKARLYYRKNRAKIRLQRRRYIRKHKSVIKHRKQFMRYKPRWFRGPKKPPAPKKPKKFKVTTPKRKPKTFRPR